jgi:methylthioribose-1-phosphate isomerase
MTDKKGAQIVNIKLCERGDAVILLDQTRLPNETVYVALQEQGELFDAIKRLMVRGAPAIGIFAAYALYVLVNRSKETAPGALMEELRALQRTLAAARPTAVNLGWALERMARAAESKRDESVDAIKAALLLECRAIHEEDMRMCSAIAEHGLTLLKDGDGVLTHCNAGPLATSSYGTALGPLLLAKERGMNIRVFADETRPLLQGARLTAFELKNAGVDVTLICDNMAGMVMKNGWINACFVGCDRVAANGDVANKIGTSGVAILARHYGIPFYVLGPTSSIDLTCKTGADIEIELRDGEEIRSKFYEKPMAPEGVKCYNPAFDVTDNGLISAIVTQRGVCRAPFDESLAALFR